MKNQKEAERKNMLENVKSRKWWKGEQSKLKKQDDKQMKPDSKTANAERSAKFWKTDSPILCKRHVARTSHYLSLSFSLSHSHFLSHSHSPQLLLLSHGLTSSLKVFLTVSELVSYFSLFYYSHFSLSELASLCLYLYLSQQRPTIWQQCAHTRTLSLSCTHWDQL